MNTAILEHIHELMEALSALSDDFFINKNLQKALSNNAESKLLRAIISFQSSWSKSLHVAYLYILQSRIEILEETVCLVFFLL